MHTKISSVGSVCLALLFIEESFALSSVQKILALTAWTGACSEEQLNYLYQFEFLYTFIFSMR